MKGGSLRVAVVGAGIAGLAAAHRLVELSRERDLRLDLTVVERGRRPGGTIQTERADGFIIEAGPDSFISEKPWALRLCERIGLRPRLIGTRSEHRRTYVVHDSRLHALPDGFLLLAPTRLWPLVTTRLFTWPGKLRMALDLVLPRGAAVPDESLASFVTRRLGRQALERVAQPLVGGIYSADPASLSLAATMPRFLEMERRNRSVILSMWRQQRTQARRRRSDSGARWSLFVSLDDGMQTLVDTLAERLPAGAFRGDTAAAAVSRRGDGWRLRFEDGSYLDADAAVLATPSYVSALLLREVDAALAEELASIAYSSSATVSLAYPTSAFPRPLDGFGFVVPLVEARGIIACTYSSLKYARRAPTGFLLLRAFVGGAQPRAWADDDGAITTLVRDEIKALLGVRSAPVLTRVHRHPDSMPQYCLGHLDRMARIDRAMAGLAGLALAGSAYRGVGIPDSVHTGELAAEALIEHLGKRS